MNDVDPISQAVEVLCSSLMRVGRTCTVPSLVRHTLQADVDDKQSHVPSRHECEALVDAAFDGLEPAWFGDRWPRTLGLMTLTLRG